jgi:hypothetical protein
MITDMDLPFFNVTQVKAVETREGEVSAIKLPK